MKSDLIARLKAEGIKPLPFSKNLLREICGHFDLTNLSNEDRIVEIVPGFISGTNNLSILILNLYHGDSQSFHDKKKDMGACALYINLGEDVIHYLKNLKVKDIKNNNNTFEGIESAINITNDEVNRIKDSIHGVIYWLDNIKNRDNLEYVQEISKKLESVFSPLRIGEFEKKYSFSLYPLIIPNINIESGFNELIYFFEPGD